LQTVSLRGQRHNLKTLSIELVTCRGGTSTRIKLHPSVRHDLFRRRVRNGWPEDLAANEPAKARRPSGTITVEGNRVPLVEILRQSGVGLRTYHSRRRIGWSAVRAATTPPGRFVRPDAKTEPFYEYRGKRMSLWAWSKKLGMNYRTLLQRVNRGLSFEEAIRHKLHGPLPKKSK
jgi:hypothetical protein